MSVPQKVKPFFFSSVVQYCNLVARRTHSVLLCHKGLGCGQIFIYLLIYLILYYVCIYLLQVFVDSLFCTLSYSSFSLCYEDAKAFDTF